MTDLNVVLQEVTNDLAETIQEHGIVIETTQLPTILAVPFQMQQLFNNLIANAIKFRKKDNQHKIVIEAELREGKDILEFRLPAEKQYHHLCISDNGIGFDPQYAEKIFAIFQRLHGQSEYEGTGIGLAICKKIVETHKGFITAKGELQKGASFHIFLPVNEEDVVVKKEKTLNGSLPFTNRS